jgi:hypothetical protein
MKIKSVLLFVCLMAFVSSFAASKIEIKGDWYYLNGSRFFIKAIGYEIGARPGQHPYEGVRADNLDLLAFDLKVIKEAGYNAIRTWSQFSEPQLKLVQASGLKLIMGIDVNPEKDYGDAAFVSQCQDKVHQVLSYARKYDCIITYLILNEPQTDHVHAVTGNAFSQLMKTLIDQIHLEHPGIPVTISANAMISDYIDENLFDVYAYNCYDHTEAQTATMGMKDYIRGLVSLQGLKKPFITTEFGYSVSHKGFGRYGGNTLEEQSHGLIANYRDLLDAGATGMCPFYYADGWWKGGDAFYHNADQPEEWFGFWGYSDVNDKFGSPRPVWFAMRDYMKGLILSPKNKEIYFTDTLPVELYVDGTVRKVLVKDRDRVLKTISNLKEGYRAEQLVLQTQGIEDKELSFEFYDQAGLLLKSESIQLLVSSTPFELPTLHIDVTPDKDLNDSKLACIKTTLSMQPNFKLNGDLRVSFNTHLGWEVGPQATVPLKGTSEVVENFFHIPDHCWVVNASAGVSVKYGKFEFRLHDMKLRYRGDWAKNIGHETN